MKFNSDKSLGQQILEMMPEDIQEELIKEVKLKLIERREVVEAVKQKELTADEKKKFLDNMLDRIM